LRMNVLRPVGSGHVPIPLGASRSDHHLTRQTPQRSNGSARPVKISFSKNSYRFQIVSAQAKGGFRKGTLRSGAAADGQARRNGRGSDACPTTEADRAAAPCAFLLPRPFNPCLAFRR